MPEPKPLSTLLEDVAVVGVSGDAATPVRGLTHDSRLVQPGWLFVAYQGVYRDVHQFIPDALANGAAALLVERPIADLRGEHEFDADTVVVQVRDARLARGLVAAALYNHPTHDMAVFGVTGTDGKTSTTLLTHAMLSAAGCKTGAVSTVNARLGREETDTGLHVTTPEPEDLQGYLALMRKEGVEAAVLEVTSHGLHQHRVAGVDFDVAVLTNITYHEALEYHGTFEAYREAKAMLFRALQASRARPDLPKTAVLNASDPSFAHFRKIPAARTITFSATSPADFRAEDISHSPSGLEFTAATPEGRVRVSSKLLGSYNAANCLAAMAASSCLGAKRAEWEQGVAAVDQIPGRMEVVDEGQPFMAIVDFAHTPNALSSALATAHELVGPVGRVIVVFGCAGLRDPGKRLAMGRHAGELADLTFITAEDPRTEELPVILESVAQGVMEAGGEEGKTFWIVDDRFEAIRRACATARDNDVVLVCGKGHEQSMCFGETEYPWDDREALRAALTGRRYDRLPTSAGKPPIRTQS